MEAERLPRGADRPPTSSSARLVCRDVEWTVQLLQLEHAHAHPELRTTSTLGALAAARAGGLVDPDVADELEGAWSLTSRMRNAAMLFRGRPMDSLPSGTQDANGIARILGLPPGSGQEFAETYRRVARRARSAMQTVFYDSSHSG